MKAKELFEHFWPTKIQR